MMSPDQNHPSGCILCVLRLMDFKYVQRNDSLFLSLHPKRGNQLSSALTIGKVNFGHGCETIQFSKFTQATGPCSWKFISLQLVEEDSWMLGFSEKKKTYFQDQLKLVSTENWVSHQNTHFSYNHIKTNFNPVSQFSIKSSFVLNTFR